MNVLIVSTNCYRMPTPVMPLGACIAAEAAERAGHSVQLLDMMFQRRPLSVLRRAVSKARPDVIGFSIRNIDNNDIQNPVELCAGAPELVAAAAKECDAELVIGGAAVGVMPEALLRATGARWAALGDGEHTLPALLAALSNGADPRRVPGVAWLEKGKFRKNEPLTGQPLGDCFVPDFPRWLNVRHYISSLCAAPLQTKRGCPHKCVYCSYAVSEGRRCRLAPPASVVNAVKRLASFGIGDVEFVDNVFNSPLDHAMEICRRLAAERLGVRFQTLEMNPKFITDPLLDAMDRAGFVGMAVNAESASDPVLHGLGKGYTAQDVHRAAATVRRHQVPCVWIFMCGGPGETPHTLAETLKFAERNVRKSDVAFFNLGIRIYPGTPLERTARKQGVLTVPAAEMLMPVFYLSPDLDMAWAKEQLNKTAAEHLNYFGPEGLSLPMLPALHRLAWLMGVRPPLWRHTRIIKRLLRLAGKVR